MYDELMTCTCRYDNEEIKSLMVRLHRTRDVLLPDIHLVFRDIVQVWMRQIPLEKLEFDNLINVWRKRIARTSLLRPIQFSTELF